MQTLIRNTQAVGEETAILTSAEEIGHLISLFEAISKEEGWQPGDSLRRYVDRSVYFAGFVNDRMAGGIQLVLSRPNEELPCLTIWP